MLFIKINKVALTMLMYEKIYLQVKLDFDMQDLVQEWP